ncbi:hypothetical protein [Elioraea tepidiphila]|jgi:hypothetical protein|uniref:hypothetical protein n=1 Tax=Elioraea tepidiphila TaxID=457934 RepID=UPI00036DFB45|nr:hypothetical protein [Elioraea tepidiphila]
MAFPETVEGFESLVKRAVTAAVAITALPTGRLYLVSFASFVFAQRVRFAPFDYEREPRFRSATARALRWLAGLVRRRPEVAERLIRSHPPERIAERCFAARLDKRLLRFLNVLRYESTWIPLIEPRVLPDARDLLPIWPARQLPDEDLLVAVLVVRLALPTEESELGARLARETVCFPDCPLREQER